MSRKINLRTVYRQTAEGVREQIPAIKGSDASITADSIESALGYEPAKQEDVSSLQENIAHQLPRPTSGIEVGKYFRVAAIDETGNPVLEAVDLPLASTNTPGMVKARSDWGGFGIQVNAEGQLYISSAADSHIDAKNDLYRPITTVRLDRAVRAGLISNSEITAADYPAIHKTLGVEKEWALKGEIIGDETDRGNIVSGARVDLQGCTQVIIEGWMTATANVLFSIYPPQSGIVNGIGTNGDRYSKIYIIESGNGMSTLYAKAANLKSAVYVSNALQTYDYINIKPSQIVKFLFESAYVANIKACDFKIYAR